MTRAFMSWRYLMLGCAVLLLTATTSVRADEKDDKGKGKGKDQKPNVIQIDLSKLPPDVAKALQKYATDSKKPGPPAEGPVAGESPFSAATLPPGLAKKAPDHPGRVAWHKAHASSEPTASPKGANGKGDDLESRLERLLREVEELRREIRKK
jgi:hypothetical protein